MAITSKIRLATHEIIGLKEELLDFWPALVPWLVILTSLDVYPRTSTFSWSHALSLLVFLTTRQAKSAHFPVVRSKSKPQRPFRMV
jgi:hypothetical protein